MQFTTKVEVKKTWKMKAALIFIRVLAACRLINIGQAVHLLNRMSTRGMLIKYRINGLHKDWKPVPFYLELDGES